MKWSWPFEWFRLGFKLYTSGVSFQYEWAINSLYWIIIINPVNRLRDLYADRPEIRLHERPHEVASEVRWYHRALSFVSLYQQRWGRLNIKLPNLSAKINEQGPVAIFLFSILYELMNCICEWTLCFKLRFWFGITHYTWNKVDQNEPLSGYLSICLSIYLSIYLSE